MQQRHLKKLHQFQTKNNIHSQFKFIHNKLRLQKYWRNQIGDVFSPMWIHPKFLSRSSLRSLRSSLSTSTSPSSSSSSSLLLFAAELDFPCNFCGADSGEISGVYSTAMLRDNSGLHLRPTDWISLLSNNNAHDDEENEIFASNFFDLLQNLDKNTVSTANSNKDDADDDLFSSLTFCDFVAENFVNQQQQQQQKDDFDMKKKFPKNSSQHQHQVFFNETEKLAYNIRCFSLASTISSCLFLHHQQQQPEVFPSFRWLQPQFDKALHEEVSSLGFSKNNNNFENLQESYEKFLMFTPPSSSSNNNNNNNITFCLPPLETLLASWKCVKRFSICLRKQDSTSKNPIFVPCLAPVISSHLIPEKTIAATNLKNKTVTNNSNSSNDDDMMSKFSLNILSGNQLLKLFFDEQNQNYCCDKNLIYIGGKMLSFSSLRERSSLSERWYLVVSV